MKYIIPFVLFIACLVLIWYVIFGGLYLFELGHPIWIIVPGALAYAVLVVPLIIKYTSGKPNV